MKVIKFKKWHVLYKRDNRDEWCFNGEIIRDKSIMELLYKKYVLKQ